MAHLLRPLAHLTSILLPVLATLASCGGGGSADPGGGGGPNASPASLFIDTAAGSNATVEGRIAAVAVEFVGGRLSGNLLPAGSADVVLARPDGAGVLVELTGVPRGACVALHLLFAESSLHAVMEDGTDRAIVPASHAQRLEFAQPWSVGARRSRITLRHGAPLTLTAGPGDTLVWDPDVDVVPTDVIPIRFGRLEVIAIDRSTGRIDGLLTSMGDRPVALGFADDPLLLREPSPTPLTEAEFVDGLRLGARLLVGGLLDLDDQLVATTAVDLGVDDRSTGHGQKGELSARILEIETGRDAIRVAVFEVEKGEHLLPSPAPRTLSIDGARARIKWVPRRGRHAGHLPFAALEVGMVVEVSWHGAAVDGEIDADKIDIRSQGNCYERAIEGEVIAVSTDEPRQITMRLPESVVIDGRDLREVEIGVGNDVPIVRESGSSLRFVDLGDIVPGEIANVLLDARGRGRFRASLVVLGWR